MGTKTETEMVRAVVVIYLRLLWPAGPMPIVRVTDTFKSWEGCCRWRSDTVNTTIEIQRRTLADPRTLHRVVAHEVCHHVDLLQNIAPTYKGPGSMRAIRLRDGHGDAFKALAKKVDAFVGEAGFVTLTCNDTYILQPTRPFMMLIRPVSPGSNRLMWCWGLRISPEAEAWVNSHIADGAKLVEATDHRFTQGSRIRRRGKWTTVREALLNAELHRLYGDAESKGMVVDSRLLTPES